MPKTLRINYNKVNPIIEEWRSKSIDYIHDSLKLKI